MKERLTARQRTLVTQNLALVPFVLAGLKKSGRALPVEEEDLYAAGCLGLCGAAQRWGAEPPDLFPVYACREVRREMGRALREGAAQARREASPAAAEPAADEALRWAEEKQLGREFATYVSRLDSGDARVLRCLAAGLPVREAAVRLGRSESCVYAARRRLRRLFYAWLGGGAPPACREK